jgi:hypothetical protein
MAILRSIDGSYYEVPDEQVAKFKIPQEKLSEKLGAHGNPSGGAPHSSPGSLSIMDVHIYCNQQGRPIGVDLFPNYGW